MQGLGVKEFNVNADVYYQFFPGKRIISVKHFEEKIRYLKKCMCKCELNLQREIEYECVQCENELEYFE